MDTFIGFLITCVLIWVFIKLARFLLNLLFQTNKAVIYFKRFGVFLCISSLLLAIAINKPGKLLDFFVMLFFIGLPIIGLSVLLDTLKHCAWCLSRSLKFKDGQRIQIRSILKSDYYVSTYICQDCGAVTKCESKYGNFTNKNTKKVSRYLVSSGKGERAGQDLQDVYKR